MRELDKMRALGAVLTVAPSVELPLWRLQHEHQRLTTTTTTVQRVKFMKMGLSILLQVLELVAVKFVKRLNGWAACVTTELESGNYDNALEEIYRSMYGRGPPNPWLQLGFMIIGSAAMFVFRPQDPLLGNGGGGGAGSNGGGGGGFGMGSLFGGLMNMFGGGGGSNNKPVAPPAPPPPKPNKVPSKASTADPSTSSTQSTPSAVPKASVVLPEADAPPVRRRAKFAPPEN